MNAAAHRPVNMGIFKGTVHREVIGLKPHLRALSLLSWDEILGLVTLQAHRDCGVTLTAARAVLPPDILHTVLIGVVGKEN
jgi:hypothetical protein